jgi:hypothetical protein
MAEKLKWAKYWASKGFSVVPVHYVLDDGSCSCSRGSECESPGKHPAPSRWVKYQKECANIDQLEMWFEGRFKDYNIGVVTGVVSGNVFAVDVDIAEGKAGQDTLDDLCMANDDLPVTFEQRTGSGGKHIFLRAPEGQTVITGKNVLGDGVDTRGEGGFVVVAPSNHKSGRNYSIDDWAKNNEIDDCPDWLLEIVKTDAHRYDSTTLQDKTTNMWGDLVDGREGYMVQLIMGTIRTWWATKGVLPTVEELIEDAWPTFERKAIARGSSLAHDNRGIDQFTRKAQYQLKRAHNNELRILHGVEPASEQNTSVGSLTSGVSRSESPLQTPTTQGFRITDWGMKRYAGEPPEMEWLIDGILPRRVPGLLSAIGGLGKSFILLDLAMKVAGGDQGMHQETALGGRVVHNGKVVFFGAEDSANSMHRRIASIGGPNLRDRAADNLFVVPMPDAGGPTPLIVNAMGQYSVTPAFEEIRKQLLDIGDIALIIIDPLQAFAAADINTDPAAGQYWWSLMSHLCVETNANIIIAHHMRKDGAFNITKATQAREAIRGTTALVDGARWAYGLWAMNEADELVLAQKMDNIEAGVGQCAQGAVVKTNDQCDMHIRSFIRGETGLLMDRTMEVSTILDASTKLDRGQTKAVFEEINRRWNTSEPFSMAANTTRSLQAFLHSDYGMPKRAAKSYIEAWSTQGFIESTVHDSKTKTKGIKVIKAPDQPQSWSAYG